MATKKRVRHIDLDQALGEYVLTEDGTVVQTGKNPDHLSNWSLATDSECEVSHDYDLRQWEAIRWKR